MQSLPFPMRWKNSPAVNVLTFCAPCIYIPRCSQDSECIVAYCSCCQRRSGLLNTSIKQAPTIVLVSINMAKTPLSRSQCWNEIGKIKYKALVAIEPAFGVVKTTPVSDTAVNERAYDSHARLAAKTLRYEITAYKNTDQLNRIFSHHLLNSFHT